MLLSGSDETVDEVVEVGDTSTSEDVEKSLVDCDVRMTGRHRILHVPLLLVCTIRQSTDKSMNK